MKTFPAPAETTTFLYIWDLDVNETVSVMSNWQSFVDTDIPQEFGGEVVLLAGSAPGRIGVQFFGGYYGPADNFNATVQPFWDTFLSAPASANVTVGDWMVGLEAVTFGGLNTSAGSDISDAFYAKSLMTPEAVPMTEQALTALVKLLGDSFNATTVGRLHLQLNISNSVTFSSGI